jgi:hypothetical protein
MIPGIELIICACPNQNSASKLYDLLGMLVVGVCPSVVVKALCYEPEGRGFETA